MLQFYLAMSSSAPDDFSLIFEVRQRARQRSLFLVYGEPRSKLCSPSPPSPPSDMIL